jgi:hypothetical protein
LRFPRTKSRKPAFAEDEIVRSYETHPRYLEERKSLSHAYYRQIRYGHGWLGSHRRYLGYRRSGNIQALLTCLLFLTVFTLGHTYLFFGIFAPVFAWFIIDLFLLPGMTRSANQRLLRQIAHEEGGLPYSDPEQPSSSTPEDPQRSDKAATR